MQQHVQVDSLVEIYYIIQPLPYGNYCNHQLSFLYKFSLADALSDQKHFSTRLQRLETSKLRMLLRNASAQTTIHTKTCRCRGDEVMATQIKRVSFEQ